MSSAGSNSGSPVSMKPTSGTMIGSIRSSAPSACHSAGASAIAFQKPRTHFSDRIMGGLALSGLEGGAVVADPFGRQATQAPLNPVAERVEHHPHRVERRLYLRCVVKDRLVVPETCHPAARLDQHRRNDDARQIALEFEAGHRELRFYWERDTGIAQCQPTVPE
jgi:hypothetical protein